jgi:rSAM/selenodomain-associated transferase 2
MIFPILHSRYIGDLVAKNSPKNRTNFMAAPLTIIIPTLNAAAALQTSLPSLIEGLEAGLITQLIISDAGSTDATIKIVDEAGALVVAGTPGRGLQLHAGATAARKDGWFLFLHADTILPPGWALRVQNAIQNPQTAYYFDLRFDAKGIAATLTARWANLRSRIFHLPYGDQGLLISSQLYDDIGGFDPIALMEDVAMARKLGRRLEPLNMPVTTSAVRYTRNGSMRQGMRNLTMLLRYLAGTSPEKLSRQYNTQSCAQNK